MKYKLDLDDLDSSFDGWAFVHFHSPTPCYMLADSLNRLYDYRLARIDEMTLDGVGWPLFRHEDGVRHLVMFLVDCPEPTGSGNKMLIIKGKLAEQEARLIHTDFATPPACDEGDLLAKEHADLLETLLADFTVASLLDFDSAPTTRQAVKDRAAMQQLCNNMLNYIEQHHLDLCQEELLQMEK